MNNPTPISSQHHHLQLNPHQYFSNLFFTREIISLAMSLNTLNRFPVEIVPINLNSIQIALVVGLVEFFLLHIFLDKKKVYRFLSGFSSSIQSNFTASSDHAATNKREAKLSTKQEKQVDDQSVSRDDMELVLRSLGMFGNSKKATLPESLNSDELLNLFEKENPRMEELKETFGVFDKNKDGFIDAKELQSVLCALGLKEGSELESCKRMIGRFDQNGDGRIDFDEFVEFMENSLC